MIHITTGNRLDVVYDYEGYPGKSKQVIRGLKKWGSTELIPLPEPEGLMKVLAVLIKECEEHNK